MVLNIVTIYGFTVSHLDLIRECLEAVTPVDDSIFVNLP